MTTRIIDNIWKFKYTTLFWVILVITSSYRISTLDTGAFSDGERPLTLYNSKATTHLVVQGYKKFNIFRFGQKYYGVSWEDGAFEIKKVERNEYKRCYPGDSIAEVKYKIDKLPVDLIKSVPPNVPQLIEKGYKQFNIILYGDKYYGVSWEDGAFEIKKVERNEYKRCFEGDSVDEVKQLIDKSLIK